MQVEMINSTILPNLKKIEQKVLVKNMKNSIWEKNGVTPKQLELEKYPRSSEIQKLSSGVFRIFDLEVFYESFSRPRLEFF